MPILPVIGARWRATRRIEVEQHRTQGGGGPCFMFFLVATVLLDRGRNRHRITGLSHVRCMCPGCQRGLHYGGVPNNACKTWRRSSGN